MKNGRLYGVLLFLGCLVTCVLLYLLMLRPFAVQAYQGSAPDWFQKLIDLAYPRFQVERQRFELEFFLYKADQILIRSLLVLGSFWFLLRSPSSIIVRNTCVHSGKFYLVLTTIFYLGLLYYTWDWYLDLEQVVRMKPFYHGVLLFRILHLPVLPLALFYALHLVYVLAIILVLFRYKAVVFASLTALILLLFQGYSFSFEKVDHGLATLSYAAMLMPVMLYEIEIQSIQNKAQQDQLSSFALFLIQFMIAGVYFLSGVEKLLTSGFNWANATTFRTYIALHDQPLGLKLAKIDILAHLLPWGALLFQLCFILILFQKRWKYMWLVLGIFFHLGTKLMMGIGPYFSSWIFVYVFFIDWDVLFRRGTEFITHRHKHNQKGA